MTTHVALTGASGQLGTAFQKLAPDGFQILILPRDEVARTWLDAHKPDVIVNAAAFNAVEHAEHDRAAAFQANADFPETLALWTATHGARLIHFSTDYVFDGTAVAPIPEDATPHPLNAYGTSKAVGERRVLAADPHGCVIRTSAVFGHRCRPATPHNFVEKILARATAGAPFPVRDDLVFRPTWADDLARATVHHILNPRSGIFHFASRGRTTWHEWAREILALAGHDPAMATASHGDPAGLARRPRYTVLADSCDQDCTDWKSALEIYMRTRTA